jgi:hypothetical protein
MLSPWIRRRNHFFYTSLAFPQTTRSSASIQKYKNVGFGFLNKGFDHCEIQNWITRVFIGVIDKATTTD